MNDPGGGDLFPRTWGGEYQPLKQSTLSELKTLVFDIQRVLASKIVNFEGIRYSQCAL